MSLPLARASVPRFKCRGPSPYMRPQSCLAMGVRARCRTRPAFAERLQASRSRAPYQHHPWDQHNTSLSFSPLLKNSLSICHPSPSQQFSGPILQSAFPKKTFLFLLALGTFIYLYTDVIVISEPCWHDQLAAGFAGNENGAMPFHFYADRDQIDEIAQEYLTNPSARWRDPEILKALHENFAVYANGWAMTEEESLADNIPVTHGCRFKSNQPSEDYFAIGTAPGPGGDPWNYWSVFDGHAGRHTAFYLQWYLHPNLARALSALPRSASPVSIHQTIKDVFLRTDNDIMTAARHAANWYPPASAAAIAALQPALSGSCAVLAAFDPSASKLRVACVGDSRAVLGRWDPAADTYAALPLSVDQTGFNPAEVARITAAHPDEPDILDPKSGRLLGLAVSRAFGDHRWKWDNDFVTRVQHRFWGTPPRPKSKTPPYLDAEPVITETDIVRVDPSAAAPGKSDFMIMASDGLWDRISSEHAVQCVQAWLEARARGNGRVSDDPQLNKSYLVNASELERGVEDSFDDEAGGGGGGGGGQVEWKAEPRFFAIEDDNAAVCLARNAMGGTRRGILTALLALSGPALRDAVDDTTVMVVFFDRVPEKEGGKERAMKAHAVGHGEKKSIWWPW